MVLRSSSSNNSNWGTRCTGWRATKSHAKKANDVLSWPRLTAPASPYLDEQRLEVRRVGILHRVSRELFYTHNDSDPCHRCTLLVRDLTHTLYTAPCAPPRAGSSSTCMKPMLGALVMMTAIMVMFCQIMAMKAVEIMAAALMAMVDVI